MSEQKTFSYKDPETGAIEIYDQNGELVGIKAENVDKTKTLEERAIPVTLPSGTTVLVDPATTLPDERWHYSKELGMKICDLVVEGGMITDICDGVRFPPFKTVSRWKRQYPEFQVMLSHAYEDQAEYLGDKMRKLADGTNEGNFSSKSVQIQTYKHLAGVNNPARFQSKAAQAVGQVAPTTVVIVTGIPSSEVVTERPAAPVLGSKDE